MHPLRRRHLVRHHQPGHHQLRRPLGLRRRLLHPLWRTLLRRVHRRHTVGRHFRGVGKLSTRTRTTVISACNPIKQCL